MQMSLPEFSVGTMSQKNYDQGGDGENSWIMEEPADKESEASAAGSSESGGSLMMKNFVDDSISH